MRSIVVLASTFSSLEGRRKHIPKNVQQYAHPSGELFDKHVSFQSPETHEANEKED